LLPGQGGGSGLSGEDALQQKLNREDREDREENSICSLCDYRFCQIMRWIPCLMRVTFQLTREQIFSLRSLRS
jgi:hypothetical protein